MDAKEKAQALYDMFYNHGHLIETSYAKDHCKKCATIVAIEMIKQLEELCKPEYTSFWHGKLAGETVDGYELKDYWETVKLEIEKL